MALLDHALAFWLGCVALSYELVWYRTFAYASGGASPVFGTVVASYLVGLALGALVARRLLRDSPQRRPPMVALSIAAALPLFVVPGLGWLAVRGHLRLGVAFILVGATGLGVLFPYLLLSRIRTTNDIGLRFGGLSLTNSIGSAVGTVLTGFVLMDVMPLSRLSLALYVAGAMSSAFLLALERWNLRKFPLVLALVGAPVLFGTQLFDGLYEKLQWKTAFVAGKRFRHIIETRSAVITATEEGEVFGDGVYDGWASISLKPDPNRIVRAFYAAAIHPAPRRALLVGLGAGAWANVLLRLPGVEHVTILEINRGYVELIRRYPTLAGILANPKVSIVFDDARRWMAQGQGGFDLIVQNTTWHWRAYVSSLLSREYLAIVRARLEKGGVFYYNTTSSEDAQRTGAEAFPYALRIAQFLAVSDAPIAFDRARLRQALVDFRLHDQPILNLSEDERRLEEILSIGLIPTSDPKHVLESRPALLARTRRAGIITDDNMGKEWSRGWKE